MRNGMAFALAVALMSAMAAMAEKRPDAGVRWIDAKTLPIEGRAFDNTKFYYDRLPVEAEGRVPDRVWRLSHDSCGMLYRFRTDTRHLSVKWRGSGALDVYRRNPDGGKWIFDRKIGARGGPTNVWELLWRPGHECLVYLPNTCPVQDVCFGVDAQTKLDPIVPAKKPIVWYGVSSTQGVGASRPGMNFPAIVSRRLDVPFVNLSFSGAGKMEMEMCDYVAAIDACVYVLDTAGNMDEKLVRERYEKFVRELHRRRPDVPIVLTEERVYNSERKLPTPRSREIAAIRDRLAAESGWKLGYVRSEEMFPRDTDDTAADADGGHPNDFGMMMLADAYQRAIEAALGKK